MGSEFQSILVFLEAGLSVATPGLSVAIAAAPSAEASAVDTPAVEAPAVEASFPSTGAGASVTMSE